MESEVEGKAILSKIELCDRIYECMYGYRCYAVGNKDFRAAMLRIQPGQDGCDLEYVTVSSSPF